MGRSSIQAGKRFERRIANELRRWLGDDWNVARNQTDRQKGQVEGCYGEFKIDHDELVFPFCIECKDGSGFQEHHLLSDPAPGPLSTTPSKEGFWEQARRQALAAGLRPLLIFRKAGSTRVYAAAARRDMIALLPAGKRGPHVVTSWDGHPVVVANWGKVLRDGNIAEMIYARSPRG